MFLTKSLKPPELVELVEYDQELESLLRLGPQHSTFLEIVGAERDMVHMVLSGLFPVKSIQEWIRDSRSSVEGIRDAVLRGATRAAA